MIFPLRLGTWLWISLFDPYHLRLSKDSPTACVDCLVLPLFDRILMENVAFNTTSETEPRLVSSDSHSMQLQLVALDLDLDLDLSQHHAAFFVALASPYSVTLSSSASFKADDLGESARLTIHVVRSRSLISARLQQSESEAVRRSR